MKKLIVIAMLVSGCTVTMKPDAQTQAQLDEIVKAVNQHAIVLNGVTGYIGDLQAKGKLPKPEQAKK